MCTSLQTDNHTSTSTQFFMSHMLFLMLNQSIEGFLFHENLLQQSNKKSQSNLRTAALPPLMAENNYATTGCPTFTPKTATYPSMISTHLIHPSLNCPHLPPQMASRSDQLFFHNSPTTLTDGQTDRQAIWARCVTFAGLPFGH